MARGEAEDDLPANYKDYPDGSLLRVIFHDFLTYEHTSFIPTANLNMILGHNGSGKSSIICGICLACGGSPKSLGRSEKIVEYVRHGCQEGYVEISIADQAKGPQTIRLTIRVGKVPEYKLNGEITTQTILAQLRKHYNIQIDNPCAFLAQDKVKSFSEQSSTELLRNTEKAASDDLFQQHEGLIEQRIDSMSIEDKCASAEKAVKLIESEIAKLVPFVENYRKKLALQTKLRLLERKLAILEYEKANSEYQEELAKMDEALGEYRDVEREIQKGDKRIKEFTDRAKAQKRNVQKLTAEIDNIHHDISHTLDKKRMQRAVEKSKQQLEYARVASEKHEKELEEISNRVEMAKEKLAQADEDYEGIADFNRRVEVSDRNHEDVTKAMRKEEDGLQKMNYQVRMLEGKQREQHLEASQNVNERIRCLHAFSPDAGRAYDYYRKNKDQFRGRIFTPMTDITLKFPEAAKALENSVGNRDRALFVCQFKEDEQKINGRDAKWSINTSVVTKQQLHDEDINGQLPGELKRLGFKFLVSESFDAPPELKQYLCNVANLSHIPFGGTEVERNADDVAKKLPSRYSVFLTDGLRCQVSFSKYSGDSLQTQAAMRDARTFRDACYRKSPRVTVDDSAIRAEVEELNSKIKEISRDVARRRGELQEERELLRKEQLEWKAKNQVRMKWKRELEINQSTLKQLEKQNIDVESAQRDLDRLRETELKATIRMVKECVFMQEQLKKKTREMAVSAFIESVIKHKSNKLGLELDDYHQKLDGLSDAKRLVEQDLKEALSRRKAASDSMKTSCQLKHLNEQKMEANEKRIWEKLNKMFEEGDVPKDLDGVEDAINSERTRLKLAEEQGEDGSIEHEQKTEELKVELENEKVKQEKLAENRTKLHETLATKIETWKAEVEKMIEEINENYVKYFGELGCRGEVSLETPENTLDIEKYGIMIMVCFRTGEKMKRLDNRVQSGGERSVATMLYLLALQQLCPVPFRCIDEINQGMDPTNERKVFDIMVGLWNGSDGALTKTQYFLLSPKLLHGLDMRENVNIVMVNSTLVDHHGKKFDTQLKLDQTLAALQLNA